MNREILKQVIADQREYQLPETFFNRIQSHTIEKFVNNPTILIITGIRRSGKSTIQRILLRELSESDYYFNFDDERLISFKVQDFQMLLEVFIELFGKQSTFYFDEIQNIEGWNASFVDSTKMEIKFLSQDPTQSFLAKSSGPT